MSNTNQPVIKGVNWSEIDLILVLSKDGKISDNQKASIFDNFPEPNMDSSVGFSTFQFPSKPYPDIGVLTEGLLFYSRPWSNPLVVIIAPKKIPVEVAILATSLTASGLLVRFAIKSPRGTLNFIHLAEDDF